MNDPNTIAAASTPVADHRSEPNELEVIDGGVTITVHKTDGCQEQVKVRQLPIRLLEEWGRSGDQAEIAELLCDKIDRHTLWHLRNARSTEIRLLELLRGAPFEQIGAVEERLAAVRTEIERHEDGAHWSDQLTQESIIEIIELGDRLNRPRLARWAETQAKTIGQKMKTLMESLSANSSSASQLSNTSNLSR